MLSLSVKKFLTTFAFLLGLFAIVPIHSAFAYTINMPPAVGFPYQEYGYAELRAQTNYNSAKYMIFKKQTYDSTTSQIWEISYFYVALPSDAQVFFDPNTRRVTYTSASSGSFYHATSYSKGGDVSENDGRGFTNLGSFSYTSPRGITGPDYNLYLTSESDFTRTDKNTIWFFDSGTVPIINSVSGEDVTKNYDAYLTSSSNNTKMVAPFVFYKNEDVMLNIQDYAKVETYLDGQYYKMDMGHWTRWALIPFSEWKTFENKTPVLEVRGYKTTSASNYVTYTFNLDLKEGQINPETLQDGDDPTDGSWFDDIKQPTPPDNAWDLIGWVKYISEWIVYIVKITIGMLASFGQSVADLMGQVNGFVQVLSSFFAFMPVQIGSLFGIGVTLVIILAVLKRG